MRLFPILFLAMASCVSWSADGVPLKALLVVGGGYHNYAKLTPLLVQSVAKYANATLEPLWLNQPADIERFADPGFGQGYDVIIYDMCYASVGVTPGVKAAIALIENGKPAVMVHCAMHCFWQDRKDETWNGCCGVRTHGHEKYGPFTISTAPPVQAIAKLLPERWSTPGDELYIIKQFPFPDGATATPVLLGHGGGDADYVVAWTHTVGRGRVFGTTLGHDMRTATMPEYHRLLANGLLWAAGRLGDDGHPAPGYAGPDAK